MRCVPCFSAGNVHSNAFPPDIMCIRMKFRDVEASLSFVGGSVITYTFW